MTFLRNAWYMSGWDTDVAPAGMLSRRVLNSSVLIVRDNDGKAHAMADRCPHRFVPLSAGSYDGKTVQCRYHGLQFDGAGQCVLNPHGPIPGMSQVQSYPIVEKDSILWIWMGALERADPDLIPDYSFQNPAENFVAKEYLHVRSSYLLEIDNILDLSHIEFLHASTIGSAHVSQGSYVAQQDGDIVWSNRVIESEMMPDEFMARLRHPPGTPMNRYLSVRWIAPANLALFAKVVPTGTDPENAPAQVQGHLFTPETDTTTHYWFSLTAPKFLGEGGAHMVEDNIKFLRTPFAEEDLPLLEQQQRVITETGASMKHRAVLSTDAGGMRAQRVLQRLIKAEQSADLSPSLISSAQTPVEA